MTCHMISVTSRFRRLRLAGSIVALACTSRATVGQQPTARADSVPLRADYRDLDELLQKLPTVPPPALDEAHALWLGALPMACLDRLQSRPGGSWSREHACGYCGGARDRSWRQPANSGAGYFWVPTYSLVPDHDRLRAFWGCNDWHSAVGSTWVSFDC